MVICEVRNVPINPIPGNYLALLNESAKVEDPEVHFLFSEKTPKTLNALVVVRAPNEHAVQGCYAW